MARKRLTEEQAIARWGSLRRYEGHLRAVKRYNAEHYEEQREYRRKNRAKLSQYTMEWRKTHHDQALASVKKRIKFKMETDPEFRKACQDRIRNRRTLIDLGILKKGWVLHYITGKVNREHWIYLEKEAHQALHSAFGKCNSDVPMERVLECPHLIKTMYEYDHGKLIKWKGSYNGRKFQPLCRSKAEWKKEVVK